MAICNVESQGGYMPTGLTIPGVAMLRSKKWYSAEKPWLLEDFGQVTFYEVSEEEYEKQMAIFHSERYEYQWEDVEFDLKEHN
jgi:urea carboxylase